MAILPVAVVIAGVVAALGLVVGIRRVRTRRAKSVPITSTPVRALPSRSAPALGPSFSIHGIRLGDVVLLRGSDAWLTSAIRIRDGAEDEAALFFLDGTAGRDGLLVPCSSPRVIFHAQMVGLPEMLTTPTTMEHAQDVFTRTRLIPVTVEHHGQDCLAVGSEGTWSWFESSPGKVLCYLHTNQGAFAWCGRVVDDGSLLHAAAGEATFRREDR